MLKLTLFTTSHCHLCEQAVALITQQYHNQLVLVEIVDNDQLLKQYGTSIPVLKRNDTSAELNWPFTSHDLAVFILS